MQTFYSTLELIKIEKFYKFRGKLKYSLPFFQALALLGYTGPTKSRGPNILSIDGGGIRGIIAIEILRHLEKLTGRKVQDMFDYIIGVSTGAIIAAVIGQYKFYYFNIYLFKNQLQFCCYDFKVNYC